MAGAGDFQIIREEGNVPDRDMYRTLNMGIGLVLAVDKDSGVKVISFLAKQGLKSWVIGEVISAGKRVEII